MNISLSVGSSPSIATLCDFHASSLPASPTAIVSQTLTFVPSPWTTYSSIDSNWSRHQPALKTTAGAVVEAAVQTFTAVLKVTVTFAAAVSPLMAGVWI